MHLWKHICVNIFPEHYLIVQGEMEMFSLFWNRVSDRKNDLWQQLYGNYHTQLYNRKWKCSHYLRFVFLVETMISVSYFMLIIVTFFKFSIAAICLIVLTDLNIICDIIISSINVLFDIIGINTLGLVVHTIFWIVPYILLLYVTVQFSQLPCV